MTKKFEMELLNSEELKEVAGGLATGATTLDSVALSATCNKAGDTVYCTPGAKILACVTGEMNCQPSFSSSCSLRSFSVSGCDIVTVKF